MSIALQPKDARKVIANSAREFANFVDQSPAPGVQQFRDAVQARYEELGTYVKAFCHSHLILDTEY